MNYLKLGASLYIPAINKDLFSIANGEKFPNLTSIIIDTEDSISEDCLEVAYENIENLLLNLKPKEEREEKPLVFLRVRNSTELEKIYNFENIEKLHGFVLPKFTLDNMEQYLGYLKKEFFYMPILEKDVFDIKTLEKIRDFLLTKKENILSLRIGATDILNSLGLRRCSERTIYDIAVMNQVIANFIMIFKSHGFNITSCVFESFDDTHKKVLQEEVKLDLLTGLFGKSVIHPTQVDYVHEVYKIDRNEFETAKKILESTSAHVFKAQNKMHEKETHSNWARNIIEQAKIYGFKDN